MQEKRIEDLVLYDVILYHGAECIVAKPLSVVIDGHSDVITAELLGDKNPNDSFWDCHLNTSWTEGYTFKNPSKKLIRNIHCKEELGVTTFVLYNIADTPAETSSLSEEVYMFPPISTLK